jgi:hypothetical protein
MWAVSSTKTRSGPIGVNNFVQTIHPLSAKNSELNRTCLAHPVEPIVSADVTQSDRMWHAAARVTTSLFALHTLTMTATGEPLCTSEFAIVYFRK